MARSQGFFQTFIKQLLSGRFSSRRNEIFVVLVIFIGLIVGGILLQQQQDLRQRASETCTTLASKDSCEAVPGCLWEGVQSQFRACTSADCANNAPGCFRQSIPISCNVFSEGSCASTPGCTWRAAGCAATIQTNCRDECTYDAIEICDPTEQPNPIDLEPPASEPPQEFIPLPTPPPTPGPAERPIALGCRTEWVKNSCNTVCDTYCSQPIPGVCDGFTTSNDFGACAGTTAQSTFQCTGIAKQVCSDPQWSSWSCSCDSKRATRYPRNPLAACQQASNEVRECTPDELRSCPSQEQAPPLEQDLSRFGEDPDEPTGPVTVPTQERPEDIVPTSQSPSPSPTVSPTSSTQPRSTEPEQGAQPPKTLIQPGQVCNDPSGCRYFVR